MMKAVAHFSQEHNITCEVSLENMMACGLGACLCCVEKVKAENQDVLESSHSPLSTNVCVCKEGPVFNVKRLLWQI
jgi:dihydroorotate dehydrogenase electron transfer subunit